MGVCKHMVEEISTKECTQCGEVKELSEFYSRKSKKGNSFTSDCKKCRSNYSKSRYVNNKEHIDNVNREYRENNKEKVKAISDAWYEKNKHQASKKRKQKRIDNGDEIREKERVYRENNRESILEYRRSWNKENHDHVKKHHREYMSKRLKEDIEFKILHNLRSRVQMAIKANFGEKACSTIELVGCSIQKLRSHLESKFTDEMSWDNCGDWHIDHIRPCSSFNLKDPEEQKKCFNWKNLQPLWGSDNRKKGARWEEQELHEYDSEFEIQDYDEQEST